MSNLNGDALEPEMEGSVEHPDQQGTSEIIEDELAGGLGDGIAQW